MSSPLSTPILPRSVAPSFRIEIKDDGKAGKVCAFLGTHQIDILTLTKGGNALDLSSIQDLVKSSDSGQQERGQKALQAIGENIAKLFKKEITAAAAGSSGAISKITGNQNATSVTDIKYLGLNQAEKERYEARAKVQKLAERMNQVFTTVKIATEYLQAHASPPLQAVACPPPYQQTPTAPLIGDIAFPAIEASGALLQAQSKLQEARARIDYLESQLSTRGIGPASSLAYIQSQHQLALDRHVSDKQHLTDQLNAAKDDLTAALEGKQEAEGRCERLTAENTGLKQELATANRSLKSSEALINSLKGQNANLAIELDLAKSQISDLTRQLEAKNGECRSLSDEITRVREELRVAVASLATAESTNTAGIAALTADLSSRRAELSAAQDEVASLRRQLSSQSSEFEARLGDAQAATTAAQEETRGVQVSLAAVLRQNSSLQSELDTQKRLVTSSTATISSLQGTISANAATITDLQQRLAAAQSGKGADAGQIASLKVKLRKAEAAYTTEIGQLKSEMRSLQGINRRAEETNKRLSGELSALRTQCAAAETRCTRLESELSVAKQANRSLGEEYDSALEAIAKKIKLTFTPGLPRADRTRQVLDKLKQNNEATGVDRQQILGLRAQLHTSEAALATKSTALERSANMVAQLQGSVSDLTSRLLAAEGTNRDQASQISDLRDSLSTAEGSLFAASEAARGLIIQLAGATARSDALNASQIAQLTALMGGASIPIPTAAVTLESLAVALKDGISDLKARGDDSVAALELAEATLAHERANHAAALAELQGASSAATQRAASLDARVRDLEDFLGDAELTNHQLREELGASQSTLSAVKAHRNQLAMDLVAAQSELTILAGAAVTTIQEIRQELSAGPSGDTSTVAGIRDELALLSDLVGTGRLDLSVQIEELRSSLNVAESSVLDLEGEVDSATRRASGAEREVTRLTALLEGISRQLPPLQNPPPGIKRLDVLPGILSKQLSAMAALQTQLAAATGRGDTAEHAVGELRSKLAQVQSDFAATNARLSTELTAAQGQLGKQGDLIAEQQRLLEENGKAIESLTSQLEAKGAECLRLSNRNSELEEQLSGVSQQLTKSQETITANRALLATKEQRIEELEADLSALARSKSGAESTIDGLRGDEDQLHEELGELQAEVQLLRHQNKKLIVGSAALENNLAILTGEQKQTQAELAVALKARDAALKTAATSRDDLSTAQGELSGVRLELAGQKELNQTLMFQLEQSQSRVAVIESDLKVAKDSLKVAQVENLALHRDLDAVTGARKELEEQIVRASQALLGINPSSGGEPVPVATAPDSSPAPLGGLIAEKLQALSLAEESLRQQLAQSQMTVSNLEGQLVRVKSSGANELEALRRAHGTEAAAWAATSKEQLIELAEAAEANRLAYTSLKGSQASVDALNVELSGVGSQLQKTRSDLIANTGTIAELNGKLREAQQALEEALQANQSAARVRAIEVVASERAQLTAAAASATEIGKLNHQIAAVEGRLKAALTDNDALNERAALLEKESGRVISEKAFVQEKLSKTALKTSGLEAELKRLKVTLSDQSCQLAKQQKDLTAKEKKLQALEASFSRATTKNRELEEQVTRLSRLQTNLNDTIDALKGDNTALTATITKKEKELSELRPLLAKANGDLATLLLDHQILSAEHTLLKEQVPQFEAQLAVSAKRVGQLESQLEVAKEENTKLLAQSRDSSVELAQNEVKIAGLVVQLAEQAAIVREVASAVGGRGAGGAQNLLDNIAKLKRDLRLAQTQLGAQGDQHAEALAGLQRSLDLNSSRAKELGDEVGSVKAELGALRALHQDFVDQAALDQAQLGAILISTTADLEKSSALVIEKQRKIDDLTSELTQLSKITQEAVDFVVAALPEDVAAVIHERAAEQLPGLLAQLTETLEDKSAKLKEVSANLAASKLGLDEKSDLVSSLELRLHTLGEQNVLLNATNAKLTGDLEALKRQLAELTQLKDKAVATAATAERRVSALGKENSDLQLQVTTLTASVSDLSQKLVASESIVARLKDELSQGKKDEIALKSELEVVMFAGVKTASEIQALKANLARVQETNDELKLKLAEETNKLQLIATQLGVGADDNIAVEASSLKEKLVSLEAELGSERSKHSKTLAAMRAQLEQVGAESSQLRKALEAAKKDVLGLRTNMLEFVSSAEGLVGSQKEEFDTALAGLQRKLEDKEREIEGLRSQLSAQQLSLHAVLTESRVLLGAPSDEAIAADFSATRDALKAFLTEQSRALSQAKSESGSIASQLVDQKKAAEAAVTAVISLTTQLKELTASSQLSTEELQKAHAAKLKELTSQLLRVTGEKEALALELATAKAETGLLQGQLERQEQAFQSENQALRQEIAALQSELSTEKASNATLKARVSDLEAGERSLAAQIATLTGTNGELEKQLEEQRGAIDGLKIQLTSSEARVVELEGRVADLTDERARLTDIIAVLEPALENSRETISSLRADLELLRVENELLESSATSTAAVSAQDKAALAGDLAQTKEDMEAVVAKLALESAKLAQIAAVLNPGDLGSSGAGVRGGDEFADQIRDLQAKLAATMSQVSSQAADHSEQLSRLQVDLDRSLDDVKQLRAQLTTKSSECEAANRALASLQAQADEERASSGTALADTKSELAEAKALVKTTTSNLDTLQREMVALESTIASGLSQASLNAPELLREALAQVGDLTVEKHLKLLTDALGGHKEKVTELTANLAAAISQASAADHRSAELGAQVSRLTQANRELEAAKALAEGSNADLQVALGNLREQKHAVDGQLANSLATIAKLEAEKRALIVERDGLLEEVGQLRQDLALVSSEVSILKDLLSAAVNKRDVLEVALAESTAAGHLGTEANAELARKLEQSEHRVATIETDLSQAKGQLQDVAARLKLDTSSSAKGIAAAAEALVKTLESGLTSRDETHAAAVMALRQEVATLTSKLIDVTSQRDAAQLELVSLKQELATIANDLGQLKTDQKDAIAKLTRDLTVAQTRIKAQEATVAELNATLSSQSEGLNRVIQQAASSDSLPSGVTMALSAASDQAFGSLLTGLERILKQKTEELGKLGRALDLQGKALEKEKERASGAEMRADELEGRVSSLSLTNVTLGQRVAALEGELINLKEQKGVVESTLRVSEGKVATLTSELTQQAAAHALTTESLRSDLETARVSLQKQVESNQGQLQELTELRSQVQLLTRNNDSLTSQLRALSLAQVDLQSQYDKAVASHSIQAAALGKELESNRTEIGELLALKKRQEAQIEVIKTALSAGVGEDPIDKVRSLLASNAELTEKLAASSAENQGLSTQLGELNKELKKYEAKFIDLQTQLKNAQDRADKAEVCDLPQAKREVEDKKKEIARFEGLLQVKESAIASLLQSVLNNPLVSAETREAVISGQSVAQQTHLDQLTALIQIQFKTIETQYTTLAEKNTRIGDLELQLGRAAEALDLTAQELKRTRQELSEALSKQAEMVQLKSSLLTTQEALKVALEAGASGKESLAVLEAQIRSLTSQMAESLGIAVQDYDSKLAAVKKSYDLAVAAEESKLSDLQMQFEATKSLCTKQQMDLLSLSNELLGVQQELAASAAENTALKSSNQLLTVENDRLKLEVAALKERVAELSPALAAAKTSLQAASSELGEEKEKLFRLAEKVTDLEGRVRSDASLEGQLVQAKADLVTQQTQVNDLAAQVAALNRELTDLNTALATMAKKMKLKVVGGDSKATLSAISNKIDALLQTQTHVDALLQQIADKEEENGQRLAANSALQTELKAALTAQERFKAELTASKLEVGQLTKALESLNASKSANVSEKKELKRLLVAARTTLEELDHLLTNKSEECEALKLQLQNQVRLTDQADQALIALKDDVSRLMLDNENLAAQNATLKARVAPLEHEIKSLNEQVNAAAATALKSLSIAQSGIDALNDQLTLSQPITLHIHLDAAQHRDIVLAQFQRLAAGNAASLAASASSAPAFQEDFNPILLPDVVKAGALEALCFMPEGGLENCIHQLKLALNAPAGRVPEQLLINLMLVIANALDPKVDQHKPTLALIQTAFGQMGANNPALLNLPQTQQLLAAAALNVGEQNPAWAVGIEVRSALDSIKTGGKINLLKLKELQRELRELDRLPEAERREILTNHYGKARMLIAEKLTGLLESGVGVEVVKVAGATLDLKIARGVGHGASGASYAPLTIADFYKEGEATVKKLRGAGGKLGSEIITAASESVSKRLEEALDLSEIARVVGSQAMPLKLEDLKDVSTQAQSDLSAVGKLLDEKQLQGLDPDALVFRRKEQRAVGRKLMESSIQSYLHAIGIVCFNESAVRELNIYVREKGAFPPTLHNLIMNHENAAWDLTQMLYYYSACTQMSKPQFVDVATIEDLGWMHNALTPNSEKAKVFLNFMRGLASDGSFSRRGPTEESFALTSEQGRWGENIAKLLKGEEPDEICAPSGFGKTTVVKFFLKQFMEQAQATGDRVLFLSPFAIPPADMTFGMHAQMLTAVKGECEIILPEGFDPGKTRVIIDEAHLLRPDFSLQLKGQGVHSTTPVPVKQFLKMTATPVTAGFNLMEAHKASLSMVDKRVVDLTTLQASIMQKSIDYKSQMKLRDEQLYFLALRNEPHAHEFFKKLQEISVRFTAGATLSEKASAQKDVTSQWDEIERLMAIQKGGKTSTHNVKKALEIFKKLMDESYKGNRARFMLTTEGAAIRGDFSTYITLLDPAFFDSEQTKAEVMSEAREEELLAIVADPESSRVIQNAAELELLPYKMRKTILAKLPHIRLLYPEYSVADRRALGEAAKALEAQLARINGVISDLQTQKAEATRLIEESSRVEGLYAGKVRERKHKLRDLDFHSISTSLTMGEESKSEILTRLISDITLATTGTPAYSRVQLILPDVRFDQGFIDDLVSKSRSESQGNIVFMYHDSHNKSSESFGQNMVIQPGENDPIRLSEFTPQAGQKIVMLYDYTNKQGGDFGDYSQAGTDARILTQMEVESAPTSQLIKQFVHLDIQELNDKRADQRMSESDLYQAVCRRRGGGEPAPTVYGCCESVGQLKTQLSAKQSKLDQRWRLRDVTARVAQTTFKALESLQIARAEERMGARAEAIDERLQQEGKSNSSVVLQSAQHIFADLSSPGIGASPHVSALEAVRLHKDIYLDLLSRIRAASEAQMQEALAATQAASSVEGAVSLRGDVAGAAFDDEVYASLLTMDAELTQACEFLKQTAVVEVPTEAVLVSRGVEADLSTAREEASALPLAGLRVGARPFPK